MRFGSYVAAVLVVLASAASASASTNRMANKFGIHVGMLGDPFPTVVGFNLDYNALDFMRLTAGYGSISASMGTGTGELTATTLGGGARFFLPDWNFTPVVGISWATVNVTTSGTVSGIDVGGFSASGSHMYATFGLDWQAASGFMLGAGYNMSLKSGVGGLPYINIGWAFDWLN